MVPLSIEYLTPPLLGGVTLGVLCTGKFLITGRILGISGLIKEVKELKFCNIGDIFDPRIWYLIF